MKITTNPNIMMPMIGWTKSSCFDLTAIQTPMPKFVENSTIPNVCTAACTQMAERIVRTRIKMAPRGKTNAQAKEPVRPWASTTWW